MRMVVYVYNKDKKRKHRPKLQTDGKSETKRSTHCNMKLQYSIMKLCNDNDKLHVYKT
jgi:hypothetical protein